MGNGDIESEGSDNLKNGASASEGGDSLKRSKPGTAAVLKRKEASASEVGNSLKEEAAAEVDDILKLRKLKMEAMALMKPTAAEEVAAEADPVRALKKRKKIIKQRLPQGLIDHMMARPYKPIDEIPEERLAEHSQEFRECYTTEKAIADKIFEYEQLLIKQYLTKGYAEKEIEVTDDEKN